MRRSVKFSLIFMIIASFFLCLPFFFGILAQRCSHRFLHNENQTLGKVFGVHVTLADYRRGWFSSQALLQVERTGSDGNDKIIKMIPVTIMHGPADYFNHTIFTGLGLIDISNLQLGNDFPYRIDFQENIGFVTERGLFSLNMNKDAKPVLGAININNLVLNVVSNRKANHFLFRLAGAGLQFQNPAQNVSVNINQIKSVLAAQFLGERHWKMALSLGLRDDQVSAMLPDHASTAVTLNADQINLNHLHFDTQTMAQWLKEVIELKQATDLEKPVSSTAWIALGQQLLVQLINADTSFQAEGLSIATPMGQLKGNYNASFPTLSDQHDYFDIATRDVGTFLLSVPHWKYIDTDTNMAFSLANLQYNQNNNTVFSRHSHATMDAFTISNIQATTPTAAPLMKASQVVYTSDLSGDASNLSQVLQWKLAHLCFSDDCFAHIHGKFELLKMNFDAFRRIAAETQQIVQYQPQQLTDLSTRWKNLISAYLKLILPSTKIIVSQDMMTSQGEMKLQGELSWPTLQDNVTTPMALDDYIQLSAYQFRALFPAEYVNALLAQMQSTPSPTTTNNIEFPAASGQPSFEQQAGQFVQYALTQGYLKKIGNAYALDLVGRGHEVIINGIPWKAPS